MLSLNPTFVIYTFPSFKFFENSSFSSFPYEKFPMLMHLNSMILHVSVPVLSLNMYSTCPNSSFKLDDWAFAHYWRLSSYIQISVLMKKACQNLTISDVTRREIGTKSFKIKIQVPEDTSILYQKFVVSFDLWKLQNM